MSGSTCPGSTRPASNEYLAGQTTQSVTVEFYGSYGTGEVHATLYPIHQDREIVAFAWRPDQTDRRVGDEPGAARQRPGAHVLAGGDPW